MSTDFENAFHKEPVTFLLSNALRHLTQDQQRQLCNALLERLPVVASLEQEAERLYPYQMPQREIVLTFAEVTDYKRSAHITAARQYMGEIEQLRAENAALIEEIQNWKDELKDQAREYRNNR